MWNEGTHSRPWGGAHPTGRFRAPNKVNLSVLLTSVGDQGIGIAPRDQARVFEMFERARTNELITIRGTGVGLHVVKSFVDLMGGAVWVSSRRHHGSTFSFALPIAKQSPQEGAAAAAA